MNGMAMQPATIRSGQALFSHATSSAAMITATLASASLRENSHIALTLKLPSRKRERSNAAEVIYCDPPA